MEKNYLFNIFYWFIFIFYINKLRGLFENNNEYENNNEIPPNGKTPLRKIG